MTQLSRIRIHPSYWQHPYSVPFSEDIVPSSLFLKHSHFVIFDLETQQLVQEVGGWDYVHKLKPSIVCAYDSKSDQFLSYQEHELKELFTLLENRLVIGYNIRGFDLLVLSSYGLDPKKLDIFDIMYDLETLTRQRYLKLESIAQGTLGVGKLADGLQAVEWWKTGQIQKITDYCMQDVKITRDIFQYGRTHGFIRIQQSLKKESKVRQIEVQWN